MKNQQDNGELVQMPLRCTSGLQERIIRALGTRMSKSGKKISKNEFIVHLVELGLVKLNEVNDGSTK